MNDKKTDHSARDSLLGYFYQIRYALYLILKAENEMIFIKKVEHEDKAIFIEKLDDIDFGEDYLIQVKYHRKEISLTNGSADLWKTISIWSEHLRDGIISVDKNQILELITTATAKEGSIAALLQNNNKRNPEEACKKLVEHAKTHKDKELKVAFEAFLSLTKTQQVELVRRIQIVDNAPNISKIKEKIKSEFHGIHVGHRDAVYKSLEGWWKGEVIEHLNSEKQINKYDVEHQLSNIADEYKNNDDLPLKHIDDQCPIDIENDDRRFVTHLKMVTKDRKPLKRAILHFFRANSERVDWLNTTGLIKVFDNNQNEITRYEQRLIEEWEKQVEDVKNSSEYDDFEELDDKGKKKAGWKIFSQTRAKNIKIRPDVEHEYIMEGSYHILANEDRVAWHPDEAIKIYEGED